MTNQKTYVMVDSNGFYKIGKSNKPIAREKVLQSEKPCIKLLFSLDFDIEEKLHIHFSQKRLKGEWFNLNNDDLLFIKSITEDFIPISPVITIEDGFCQRKSDNYFDANALVDYWNSKNMGNKKYLGNFKTTKDTKDFIEQLKKEGIENPFIATSGGKNAGTWMHPKLFIDLAMWLSVEFKSKVIDMVLDGLIISRNEAGDYYKEMSAVIMEKYVEHKGCKPPSMLYINEANMIREISNTKGKERNEMTEKELALITNLQKINAQLISKNVGKESRVKQLTMISTALSAEIGSRK